MTDYPGPEERVRAFVESAHESENYIEVAVDSEGRILDLTVTDIIDVLNELEEHRSLLEQIDAALDEEEGWAAIIAVRRIMGNHTRKDW